MAGNVPLQPPGAPSLESLSFELLASRANSNQHLRFLEPWHAWVNEGDNCQTAWAQKFIPIVEKLNQLFPGT